MTASARPASLAVDDPVVARLVEREAERQRSTLDLIASEGPSPASVREALGSVFDDKTAEGYAGRRFHRGTAVADELERLAIERAKRLFDAGHANVQPHSGVNANVAVYQALVEPGDAVLGMRLAHGGHLSHGDPASITGRVYRFAHYSVRADDERIDLDEVRDLARSHRPRMIVAGGSSYPREIDYAAFRAIADEVGARLWVDMAHIAGLVASGELPSPVPHADIVTCTTYKTLLGPHGGLILSIGELAKAVDRAIFPGTQGAPAMSQIAAKAVCFELASREPFRETQRRTRRLAAALARELAARGDRIVAGGTDTHMVLVDLRGRGVTGDIAEAALERIGILTNRNLIPFDPETPARTSGLRIGTPGAAVRGMDAREAPELAALIDAALRPEGDEAVLRTRLDLLLASFPLPDH
jgi:glycine hydroxymethyltransferase